MTKRFVLLLLMLVSSGLTLMAQDEVSCEDEAACTSEVADDYAGIIFSEPNVTPLTPDQDLMHDRWYMRVNTRLEIFDAPNGNLVRVMDPGFNFITALNQENGWTRINANEWVRSEALETVNWQVSSFTGVELPEEGLDHTMAWALVNMYPSPEPGAGPSEQFDLIFRYSRMNIYATEVVDGYKWYLIGPDQWVHQHRVALFLPLTEIPEEVDTERWIGIDLYEQVITAYEGDTPIFTTLTSTGLPRWPTYEGTFNIYFRKFRDDMTWGTVGDDYYYLEEVPWTMFFDEGRALHGAFWHDGFGYRRSHGCVNMTITDAYWMYQWVAEAMGSQRSADIEVGPAVHVYSSGEYET